MAEPMKPIEAETLALKALAFLAASPDDLGQFVRLTGVTPSNLRMRAGDPDILAAVMDFLLADDARLTAFCHALALDPRTLHAARRALPGA